MRTVTKYNYVKLTPDHIAITECTHPEKCLEVPDQVIRCSVFLDFR